MFHSPTPSPESALLIPQPSTAMNIAHAINDLGFGGAQRVVHELARSWPPQMVSPLILVARKGASELATELQDAGLRVEYLSETWPRMRSLIPLIPRLMRACGAGRVEVVFVHSYGLKQLLLLLRALRMISAQIVTVEHTTFSLKLAEARPLSRSIVRLGTRLLYRWAAGHICVSDGVADDLRRHLKVSNGLISIIGNPIDASRIRSQAQARPDDAFATLYEGLQRPIVLSVGRLSREKNHRLLLEAFGTSRSPTSGSVVILGEGTERAHLERLSIEMGISDRVHLPGHQKNPWWFMRRCDLFVLPSTEEAFPLALAEAMALGCRIISTRYSGNPEFATRGYPCLDLVPVGDASALSRAIDAELKADRRNCDTSLEGSDPDDVARRYAALGQALVRIREGPHGIAS